MTTTNPEVVSIFCALCGGAVELQFSEWQEACRATVRRWTCPYCQRENAGAFPGKIAWVTGAAESKARH